MHVYIGSMFTVAISLTGTLDSNDERTKIRNTIAALRYSPRKNLIPEKTIICIGMEDLGCRFPPKVTAEV